VPDPSCVCSQNRLTGSISVLPKYTTAKYQMSGDSENYFATWILVNHFKTKIKLQ